MNTKKIGLWGFLIGLGIMFLAIAWGLGEYYQKGIFLGPYSLSDGGTPVYLEFPVPASIEKSNGNWDFDYKNQFFELSDYHHVAIYGIDVVSLITIRPYPLSKSFPDPLSLKINFSKSISIDEAQKIIDAQPKHPQYWQNRAQVLLYRFASGFATFTHYYPRVMAILGVLSIIWLWVCRSVIPFMVWWGAVCVYSLVYRGLYEFYLYTSVKSVNLLLYFLFLSPGKMYFNPDDSFNLPCVVCAAGFLVIGPILFLVLGWLYLTKHIVPKQKRLFEDFLKIDKDKDKKLDMNITDVEFKNLKYDLKKKLDEYRPKPAIFLGIDDDGKDVSVPEDLWNHHIHCMGPTGAGKTATLMLPVAIQAIEKGMGACFIDLKGDYAFIKSIQQKCKEVGKKFYFFSIDPDEKTESYNPLQSGGSLSKVDRIMSALKLNQEGAASYYTGQQKTAFYKVLKKLIEQNEHISLKSVLTFLNDTEFLNRLNIKEDDIRGLIASFSNIADYPMINEDGINLKKIMDDQDVVYFNLRSQINSDLAEALGRMIITDFKYWSAKRNLHNPKFFIFVDEFQDIASEYFIAVISKVRSSNYCLILANQSRGNLLNVSKAFHDAVMINSYTKVIFNQFEDAPFWSSVTGTIRVDEAIMRMVSGEMFNEDKTVLDGKRERDGAVSKVTKALFTANTFLMLPMNKSVTWVKGMISRLTNHEFYYSKEEYKALLDKPFVYEGGKLYGDPLEYQINKESDEKISLNKTQDEKGPKKEIKPESEEKNNNKKQNNKGGKNESIKPNFRLDGGDVSPVV